LTLSSFSDNIFDTMRVSDTFRYVLTRFDTPGVSDNPGLDERSPVCKYTSWQHCVPQGLATGLRGAKTAKEHFSSSVALFRFKLKFQVGFAA
jgi:hypothetical protein